MTILSVIDDLEGQPGTLQKQPEVINSAETIPASPLATQTGFLTGNIPISDSVQVIEKPGNEHLFDLALLEEMDDNEYVSDILTIFLGNTPKELYELKSACSTGKFDAAYKMAHKIKGSTGLLQANFLLNVLAKIEETARAEKSDGLTKLAELANEEYKKIEILLKEHLRNIQATLRAAV